MREDLTRDLLPGPGEGIDPVEMARRDQRKTLPKRFYKEAGFEPVEQGFGLVLDGRPALTPARNRLVVPTQSLMQALVAEWNDQAETIDPATMPLTRILNSALDGVAHELGPVRDEILKYAGTDLLVYRAGDPQQLVEDQAKAWDPILAWAQSEHAIHLTLAEGVMHVQQAPAALAAFERALDGAIGQSPTALLRLSGLHVVTTLTGSALLALALGTGHLEPAAVWQAAQVDEDFQMRAWGVDMQAMQRLKRRQIELEAAALILAHCPV